MEVVRHGRGKRFENACGLKHRQEFLQRRRYANDSLSLRLWEVGEEKCSRAAVGVACPKDIDGEKAVQFRHFPFVAP